MRAILTTYRIHTLQNAKRREGFSRTHLLLCLSNIEGIHDERGYGSRSSTTEQLLGRTGNVHASNYWTNFLQSSDKVKRMVVLSSNHLHKPVKGWEGNITQQVGIHAFPKIEHSMNTGFSSHTTNRSHHTSRHTSLRLRFPKLERLHTNHSECSRKTSADGWYHPRNTTNKHTNRRRIYYLLVK